MTSRRHYAAWQCTDDPSRDGGGTQGCECVDEEGVDLLRTGWEGGTSACPTTLIVCMNDGVFGDSHHPKWVALGCLLLHSYTLSRYDMGEVCVLLG